MGKKPTVSEIEEAIGTGERVSLAPDGTYLNLTKELTELLNKHSVESHSDTPDFVLAEYMLDCLKAYERAVQATQRTKSNEEIEAEVGPPPFGYGL